MERRQQSGLSQIALRGGLLLVAAVAMLAVGALVPATARAQSESQVQVTADRLNVREGPSTGYRLVGSVRQGDILPATGQNSGWYQVRLANATAGWVSGLYVTVLGDASAIPQVNAPAVARAVAAGPAPSASGTIVFQTTSGGDIYAVRPDGTGLRRLTRGIDPALSPDGRTVAYTRWDGTGDGSYGSVWLANADGSGERAILHNVRQPKSPTWSQDGAKLAINMQQGGTTSIQSVCIPLGSGRPSIPPDAYDIIFGNGKVCFKVPADPYWGLRLITVATGEFADLERDTHSFGPTWNPTNDWQVVYVGDNGLVNLDVKRNAAWPLNTDRLMRAPTYSPDGTRLAVSFRQHDHWEVHTLNADGTEHKRLTETSVLEQAAMRQRGEKVHSFNNSAPAWSPNGSQIAFMSDRSGKWDIWLMNADGSNQRPLFPKGAPAALQFRYDGVDERMITWR